MGQRGPKPASSDNVANLTVVRAQRLKPPARLRPDAADAWREVVASRPAKFFTESDIPVLEAYAMQVAISREAYAALAACKAEPVSDTPPPIEAIPGLPPPPAHTQTPAVATTLIHRTANGYVTENALLKVLNTAHNQLAALAVKLNLAGTFRDGRKEKEKDADKRGVKKRSNLMFTD